MDSQNSKELLYNLKSQDFSKIDSIKFYFATINTRISHDTLKFRLFQIIETNTF
jgi:hypothetical protein